MPNGLAAHAEQSQLSSGSSAKLHASLLLDDDTHTVADPEVVEWTFSHPELQVKNGSLLAGLSERKMVRVQASAEGFSQVLQCSFLLVIRNLKRRKRYSARSSPFSH